MADTPFCGPLVQAALADPDARRVADLLCLVEVSCQLTATTELRPLLQAIEQASLRVLDCERTTIFLYDRESNELVSRVATGNAEIRFAAHRGIAGEVLRTGEVVNVPDAYTDPRFNPDIDRRTGFRTRSMLSAPLLGLNGVVVGVLQVLNKRTGQFDAWDEELVRTFSAQAGVALQRQLLLEECEEKRRLQQDLETARKIQQGLLPRRPPNIPGYEIAGWNRPADETGGDFYDFQELSSGALAFTLADVSGHGIGPALIAAESRALLRASLSLTQHLERVLALVNDLLFTDLPDDRFVTAFVGLLLPSEHRFAYISAGQGPLIHYSASTGKMRELPTSGLPLGILPRKSYELSLEMVFEPGDLLLFVTDGIVEWPNARRDRFGVERVFEVLEQNHHLPASELIQTIYRAAREFANGAPQVDDLTAVVIRRTAT